MTKPFQVGCFRYAAAVLALVGSVFLTGGTANSQEIDTPNGGQRFVSVGQVAKVQLKGGKSNRYVLLDELGEVMSTLRASDGVDLEEYVGQDVGVTARTLVDGDTPVLLAESVTTFGAARQVSNDDIGKHVALASYEDEDPLLVAGNVVGRSVLAPGSVVDGAGVGYPITYGESIVGGPIGAGTYGTSCDSAGCDSCGGGCGRSSCTSCAACPCGLPGRFWIRAEYLIWWTKGMDTPPLVTTSNSGASRSNAGVLGLPGTETLFGGELFTDSRSGGRFRIGKWCDQCNWVGFETEYMFLAGEDQNFAACDVGSTIYARPFFNTNLNREDSELVQFPGVVNGSIHVDADTSLWSISPRLRVNLACEKLGCNPCDPCCNPNDPCSVGGYRFDMLVGYRYMNLEDNLTVRESLATIDPNNPTYFTLRDQFDTSNEFHGVDVGFLWEGYKGPWSLELIGRVGFGNTSQEVSIDGATTTTSGGTSVSDRGALLALESNIGTYSRDEFTVLPELSATLGYALSARTRFLVGYTFVYWPSVARAGDQIDLNVNTDLIPPVQATNGDDVPAFAFQDTEFWAQGLSLGMEYRW